MRVGQAGRAEQLEGLSEVHLQKVTKKPLYCCNSQHICRCQLFQRLRAGVCKSNFGAGVSRAYLLVCECNDVAPALLDVAVLQNGVQHWVKLLLNVLNQHGLAKGQAVLHAKADFVA